MTITTRGLAAIKPGQWITDTGRKGAGRLAAYGMRSGGAAFYFRYTLPDGRRDSLPLGHFDPKGKDGLTLQQASDRAGELSRRYQDGTRDLRATLEAEEQERQAARVAAEKLAADVEAQRAATLGALLDAYVEQLRRDGKVSASGIENTLRNHVKSPWPTLCSRPAAEIDPDDLLAVLARVVNLGKLREASKVRSYLRAAYSAAIRARQDARGLESLRALRLKTNPARDLATITGATQARERALSVAELRAYWQRISVLPAPTGPLLQFHLLTGGQRIEQLGRTTLADLDTDTKSIRLRDPKGRRSTPRLHDVPLLQGALEALALMQGGLLGPFVFTVTGGKSGASYTVMDDRIRAVVTAMEAAGELPGGPFTVGDVRRTVETRLAAAGVSKEVRAQLQSHGLGGIQSRHYDRHEYLEEKRAALETLERLVTGKSANVVSLSRAART